MASGNGDMINEDWANLSEEEYDVMGINSSKTALNFYYLKLTNDLIKLIKQTDNQWFNIDLQKVQMQNC